VLPGEATVEGAHEPGKSSQVTDLMAIGVDGYTKGWVAVELGDRATTARAVSAFSALLETVATVIAVDIPIALEGRAKRMVDAPRAAGGRRAGEYRLQHPAARSLRSV
jgi:hypothetical protein